MDLCKVPMPYETDGATFIRLMENPGSKSFVQPAYSFYNNGITMRTDRYRITHYFRKEQPVTELYDHKNDPNENFNIAADDQRRVRQLLRQWKKGDTGLYGDDKVRGR
jgi:arylsulfatase A-like enzyme